MDRRERRQQDQALGLVPFAVKLNGELAQRLRDQAQAEGVSLNDLVDRLLRLGLETPRSQS
jgi:predicted HicB family RNase H-like nuclease